MDETTRKVGRCAVCNRVLKNPKWVDIGIGPVCYRKKQMQAELPTKVDHFDPATGDISFRRGENGTPIFNIPHTHRHHSPSGMEFGYPGSGPADFALNILAIFLPVEDGALWDADDNAANWDGPYKIKLWDGTFVSSAAWGLHQGFKQQFIATGPREGGTIPGTAIRKWISTMLETML
jgi:hypothetical protein